MPRPLLPHALVLVALGGAPALHACTAKPEPAAKPAGAAAAAVPERIWVPCELDAAHPGPLRRSGTLRVKLHGDGVAVDTEVPALCGPLFNRDVEALGVKAGEGLLYEACLKEGYLQLTSPARASGAQRLHGEAARGVTDVSFNLIAGATYSSRGLPSDRLVLSDDFWKAEGELVLRDVGESGELRASFTFDCTATTTTPAAPPPEAPPSEAPSTAPTRPATPPAPARAAPSTKPAAPGPTPTHPAAPAR